MLLITGATGRIGRRAAELALGKSDTLRLMSRTPERAPNLPGVEIVRGDFADRSSLDAAFAGVTVALVISGSGRPGERAEWHRNAFQAAARAGVHHVVYLSLQGAGPDSRYPYSRDHYVSEQYLAETRLPFTVLRNAFYMDMFLDKFDDDGIIRGCAGNAAGSFVSREDAARTAAAVLLKPPGGVHEVTGLESLTVAEISCRLSRLVGRELRYVSEPAETTERRLRQKERELWRVELAVGWYQAIACGELGRLSDTVVRYTGEPPLKLEEYLSMFPNLLQSLNRS